MVCEGRDGNMAIEYRGRALRWKEIPRALQAQCGGKTGEQPVPPTAKRKWVPPANHPWREAARRAMEKRVSKGAVATRPSLASPSAAP